MKKNIHPAYHFVIFHDITVNYKFLTRSTKTSKEVEKWKDGKEYPVIKTEVSKASHPFYTGAKTFVGPKGRVDKFNKRFNIKS